MKEEFIAAIHGKNNVNLTFYSKEDSGILTRLCAPMDYGPSRRAHDKSDRFHLWDYESDQKNHVLSLLPDQIIDIAVLDETFNPAGFISWQTNWFVSRNWDQYS